MELILGFQVHGEHLEISRRLQFALVFCFNCRQQFDNLRSLFTHNMSTSNQRKDRKLIGMCKRLYATF